MLKYVLILLVPLLSADFISAQAKLNINNLFPDTSQNSKPVLNTQPKDSILKIVILNSDGRFTLGVKGRRLMYGYPWPFSTSHFIVKVNDEYACNFKGMSLLPFDNSRYSSERKDRKFLGIIRLKPKITNSRTSEANSMVYSLKDTLFMTGFMSVHAEISFNFKGLIITQKLTPVDSNLNEVPLTSFGQYYKVDYTVKNTTDTVQKVGLLVLFDTMIDNNDACKIDAFSEDDPVKMFEGFRGAVPREIRKKRGVETHFTNTDMPKRILLYKDERKQIKDFTGDFYLAKKDAIPPDYLFIGPWGYYHSVLWNVKPSAGKKYGDSAVLMRWEQKGLKPDSVVHYTTYYGLFNPGELQAVVSDPAKLAEFKVSHDRIKRGEKSLLSWKVKMSQKSSVKIGYIVSDKKGKQKIKYIGGNIGGTGSIYVSPNYDKTYVMEIYSNRKLVGSLWADVAVDVEENENDGRFTLGTKGGNSILYGYPFSYPASHFVLTSEGKYASNNNLLSDTVTYLKGISSIGVNQNGNQYYETSYNFNGLVIKQKLIPADIEPKELSLNPSEFWQKDKNLLIPVDIVQNKIDVRKRTFFKIEYEIINPAKVEKKNIGLSLLLDVNSAGKDDAALYSKAQKIPLNSKYIGNDVPITIYDTPNSTGNFIIKTTDDDNSKPDELTIGFWEYLNSVIYNTSNKPKDYGEDVAILLKWNKLNIKPEKKRIMSVFIGNSADTIFHNYNKLKTDKSISVYYATGKAETQETDINKILKLVKAAKYDCILIEGFCDNQGDAKTNYILAQKRVNEVKQHLIKSGISEKKILIKVSGEIQANKKTEKNAGDRRVDITLMIPDR